MSFRSPRIWLVFTLLCVLVGCVTQSEGGMPGPAEPSDRVQAQLDLARGYLEQGNTERARTSLNKALEINSRSVEAHVLLAVLNAAESEWGLAERHFKIALEIDPANSQALNNYGSFLYSRGRYEEAVANLRLLVKDTDYRARSQAYENLGLAELKIDNLAAARESFSRALQLSFSQPQSSLELAQITYDEGSYAKASEHYDNFRSQSRQNARSLCLGMKLAQKQGDTDQMASYAMALSNLYPNSSETAECTVSR